MFDINYNLKFCIKFCIILLITITCFFISDHSPCYGYSENRISISVDCRETPMVWDKKRQPNIYMGNNLWRYVGSADFANGTYIIIEGRILDKNCVPVPNAVVEIWQLDANGYDSNYYDDIPESNLTLSMESMKNADKNFVGSGTAITNNLGQYKIYTIVPGTDSQYRLPHINFAIRHQDFNEFITQMYFPEDSILEKDKFMMKYFKNIDVRKLLIAKKYTVDKKILPERDVVIYKFDIVLKNVNKYVKY